MKIRTLVKHRDPEKSGVNRVHEIGGTVYEFSPDKNGNLVAEVNDPAHIQRFLSLKDAFVKEDDASKHDEKKTVLYRDRSRADDHIIDPSDGDEDPREADMKETLRTQYYEATGKAPHHTWDLAKLRAKIDEAEGQATARDKQDAGPDA